MSPRISPRHATSPPPSPPRRCGAKASETESLAPPPGLQQRCCGVSDCNRRSVERRTKLSLSSRTTTMIRIAPAIIANPKSDTALSCPLRSRQTTSTLSWTRPCRCAALHDDHRTLPVWPPRAPRTARSPYPSLAPPVAPPRQTKATLTCSASPMHPLSPTR
eukprot:scaffold122128_cov36-Phaeocystis_antarctica.AAC.2